MNYIDNYNPGITDEQVFENIIQEKKHIGYYNLANQDVNAYKEYAATVKQNNIVVIGIGGSTLGTYAIYKFLKDSQALRKKLFFLETTDPINVQSTLKNIDLEDTLFVVISKSGTTVETISVFKYINSLVTISKENTLVITEFDSKLNAYAQAHGMKTFDIPKDVGGRFSVFSAVGLVPLAIVGIDVSAIVAGIKEVHDNFFAKGDEYENTLKKARFYAENKDAYSTNVLFTYASGLEGFSKWYVQLWAESLGKISTNSVKKGLTPVGLIGPIDQHSFLQLIVEGKRDKTVTVVKVNDFGSDLTIPEVELEGLEDLNYLNNLEFASLINMQADATIESLNNLQDVPCDVITIDGIDEASIAKLMYEYELLTSVCAQFLYINAYDQPGVESGKIILKSKLKG